MTHTQTTFRTSILFLAALLLLAGTAQGVTVMTVCASGCNYGTIQSAVDAAADNDILELSPETFVEGDILIDKDLTIRTSSGRATIDGDGELTVFEIDEDAAVILEDLTFKNATRAMLTNHGALYLETVYVLGDGTNNTTYGGIANFSTGYLSIESASVVAANRSGSLGGGITNFGELEIDNSTLTGNRGRLGGAIYNSRGDVSVSSSSISFNHATVRGGGYANVHVSGGTVTILSSSSYSGNTADVDCDKKYDIHRTPICVD